MQVARPLYLASQSPRRRRMLRWMGIPFDLTEVEVDEAPLPGEVPTDLAARLAREKAQLTGRTKVPGWILTADTVVDLEGRTLGKPSNAQAARSTLAQLRDRRHQVHTGIALVQAGSSVHVRRVTTDVQMRHYTDDEIENYIATGDPMDKAGAYAIQHREFNPVSHVSVCYANVIGLPLCAVVRLLHDCGWAFDVDVPALCYLHLGYRCPGPDEGENQRMGDKADERTSD